MPITRNLQGAGTSAQQAKAIVGVADRNKTATGTTRADAYLLSEDVTTFTTVAAGTGAALRRDSLENDVYTIINQGANSLLIYPPAGGTIGTLAANAAYSLPAGQFIDLQCLNPLSFMVRQNPNVNDQITVINLADYAALRAYTGNFTNAYVTGYLVSAAPSGIAGTFVRDDSDTTSLDNGGTIIVSASGVRWKRAYVGGVHLMWFMTEAQIADIRNGTLLTDCSSSAVKAATVSRLVYIDPGIYNFKTTVTLPIGAYFVALSSRGVGGDTTADVKLVTFVHSFSGDFFEFTGTSGAITGSSFGFEDITFLQNNGSTGSANGNAIKLTSGANNRVTWGYLGNCNFEVAPGKGEFTRNIYGDGSNYTSDPTQGHRDIWISNTRFYSGAGAKNAIELLGCQNVFIKDSIVNGTKGDVLLTGSASKPTSVTWTGGTCNILELDYAYGCIFGDMSAYSLVGSANTETSKFSGRLTVAHTPVPGISAKYTLISNTVEKISTGIQFGNAAAPDELTLNYYDGTVNFTPVLSFGGASTGIAYSTQNGRATIIGNRCIFNGTITLTSKGSANGSAKISGLPVTVKNSSGADAPLNLFIASMSLTGSPQANLNTNASDFFIYEQINGANTVLTDSQFTNTTTIRFSGHAEF